METTLYTRKPSGRYAVADAATIRAAALKLLTPIKTQAIRSPADTADYLKTRLGHIPHELFCVMFLDNRHRVIAFSEMFRGTIDGTSVYPREVVKEALQHNAAAVILAHNHPSGVAEPSQADERITRRLKSALELIDVRLLDHLIIGGNSHCSLASRGIL